MATASTDNALSKAFEQQTDAKNIRNVCIIAHVDHGKTTLADSLISSNGIISARFAGKIRYLDSREDEQTRGITMKSSAVSLYHDPFLINLIDSPGHVDFCSEVSSAVNLADVAVLVVDVVEGVCSQTESLLRQSVLSQLDVILVFNKIDRLVVELRMTEGEAHRHLRQTIEHVNSCLSQIITGIFLENEEGAEFEEMERTEEKLHFDPAKGNVLFASAVHGFAFSIDDFAALWAPRLNLDRKELASSLFGDFFLSAGAIKSDAESRGKRTLFEQLVLQPVWEVHKTGLVDKDLEKLRHLASKLSLPAINTRRLDEAFDEMMRHWMPLTKAVLKACLHCKSPKGAFDRSRVLGVVDRDTHPLFAPIQACDSSSGMVVVFVSKLLKFEARKVALVRVMSGTLREGCQLFTAGDGTADSFQVSSLFAVLGRELVPIHSAPAGVICAIQLDTWLSGTTLCSELISEPLRFTSTLALEPLVRVSVQPARTEDTHDLRDALKQLAILDGGVRVIEQENGELALITAGEVHLQKCIQDLNDMGHTDIAVSEPIVPFLETIVPDSTMSVAKVTAVHLTECFMRQLGVRLKLRAVPLGDEIVRYCERHEGVIKAIRERSVEEKPLTSFYNGLIDIAKESLPTMRGSIWYKRSAAEIQATFDKIWCFGPFKAKNNVLINNIPSYNRPSVWEPKAPAKQFWPLDRAIVAGFDLAMSAGPLCQEPLQGVAIIVEDWCLEPVGGSEAGENDGESQPQPTSLAEVNDPQIHGQLISAMKATCKAAIEKNPRRLVAAMHRCRVQTSSLALGKVHTVLGQRRAKVVNEDLNQMNGLFEIEAFMPVVESFSFCEQLRKQTSGMASAQLEFSHWQLIEEDPLWVPTTEDEIEEFGIKGDSVSQARQYVDMVRKRKGILDELIVVSAEKQRNHKRNK